MIFLKNSQKVFIKSRSIQLNLPAFYSLAVVFAILAPTIYAKNLFTYSTNKLPPTTSTAAAYDDQATTTKPTQKPNRDITIGPCTWAVDRKCPDDDIKFYLYTRKNPKDRQFLGISESLGTSNLSDSHFNAKHPSKIVLHGYNSDMFQNPIHQFKDEYFAKGDYNVIYVDWSILAPGPCYPSAVHNTRHTGACVAQLVERILDMGSSDIHVIGFSLGSHVANYIARNLATFILPRITGLDPAMPLFVTASASDKLDETDAEYVDVIHTNAMVQGKLERCGHADFYMNGGIMQPGCNKVGTNPFACSHQRATAYFLESIRSPKGFWGWSCSSYISYLLGMCPSTNYLLEAGENAKRSTKGMFLINTNDTDPYALGKWTDLPTLGVKKTSTSNGYRYASIGPTIMTFIPPPQRGDPLLRNVDTWGKLDYPFNNEFSTATSYQHDLYTENWTYYHDGGANTPDAINHIKSDDNSIEEEDFLSTEEPTNNGRAIEWNEYKRNLSDGIIDNSLFSVPIVG